MFRAGIHTQTGGPYFRAGTNTGNGWATLLHSKVLWLVRWFVDLLIVSTVFHMLINRLGVRLKRAQSGDRVVTCDRVDDQSLGRSCNTFPGSRACILYDPKVVEMSHDWTHDRSGDSFPGSRGWGVDPTTWLYFSLGAALGELGLGILWMRDVTNSVLDSCGHGRGRLTLEEHKRCIDNNLCLYCGIPRHIAINYTTLPNSQPGSSFWPQSSGPSV